MIWHDYIASERNTKLGNPAMTVSLYSKPSTIQRPNRSAVAGCKSDEVERLIYVNQIQSMRAVLDHSSSSRGSRTGCNKSDSAGDTPATTIRGPVSVVATVSVASYSAGDTPAATEFNQAFNKARWLVVRILPRHWNRTPLISLGITGVIWTCTFHSCPDILGCTGMYCTAS